MSILVFRVFCVHACMFLYVFVYVFVCVCECVCVFVYCFTVCCRQRLPHRPADLWHWQSLYYVLLLGASRAHKSPEGEVKTYGPTRRGTAVAVKVAGATAREPSTSGNITGAPWEI